MRPWPRLIAVPLLVALVAVGGLGPWSQLAAEVSRRHYFKQNGFFAPQTATSKALTTYYPPNRGFFGKPVSETLSPGTRIDRYGFEGGTFASPEGTAIQMRALPPGSASKPYGVYEVVSPLEVNAGRTAPWFGQIGLGTQYETPSSIADLIEDGLLKRVN